MTIRKTKTGKWEAMIRIKGLRPIYKTFTLKSEAQRFKTDKLSEINAGNNHSLLYTMNLNDLIKRHIEKSLPYLKPKTRRDRTWQLGKIQKDFKWLVEKKLVDLSPEDFQQFKDERSNKGTINHITTNRDLLLFSKLFNEARKLKSIPIPNHASVIERFKETKGKRINITFSEYRKLLNADDLYFKIAILIAKHTGLRKSEILNLKWSDYDDTKGKFYISNTKNNHPRLVNISKKLAKDISKLPRTPKNREYIVGLSYDCFSTRYVRKQKEFGIETCMHDFRRYRTQRLVELNVNPVQIARQLGHKSLAMVGLYAGLTL